MKIPSKSVDFLIVGAGLSGIMVANQLQAKLNNNNAANDNKNKFSFMVLDARSLIGGRLYNDQVTNQIDLGGTWIWPNHQPNIQRLLRQHEKIRQNIHTFIQFDEPSSTRIRGGAVQLVHELASEIPDNVIQLNTAVTKCTLQTTPNTTKQPTIIVETKSTKDNNNNTNNNDDVTIVHAKKVIFAVPPKILQKHVIFSPPLSTPKQNAMNQCSTWMAGVSKVSLVYEHKFWDSEASNVRLVNRGPAFQCYDGSTNNNNNNNNDVFAITFFTLAPPPSSSSSSSNIQDFNQQLAKSVAQQLATTWKVYGYSNFAQRAMNYIDYHVHHWPAETYISEDPNPSTIQPHPHPIANLQITEWNDLLYFAGTETDQSSPGVMEGAIGAALRVIRQLERNKAFENSASTTTKEATTTCHQESS